MGLPSHFFSPWPTSNDRLDFTKRSSPAKPSVTLSVPATPESVSSFMHIRVADIQACYELWRNRGAVFITEPKDNYGETFCYIRDPDGYIIEVAQNKPGFAYG
jgi:catechol 2,3-dioxygenase-like lactoylglutathione lyase family enzyme